MPDRDPQQDVLQFLSALADRGGATAKRIDTHAASVFLTSDRAYKIKRAVKFPFLDYSTLEKRREACEAELRINRAFTPEIYIAVIPVTRQSNGGLALDGSGTAVEWVLEMRRFDETQTLDMLVPAGNFDRVAADQLGKIVAAMHAGARTTDAGSWLSALSRFISQNTAALKSRPTLFDSSGVDQLELRCKARFDALRPILTGRAERGLVRRCHGDLHLGNIVMIEGRPLPFDAIEFDETVASGDVMYDLAFLLMDFIHAGDSLSATTVLNRYLSEGPQDDDLDGLAALPLFMAVRAAIRAQVSAAKFERNPDDVLAAQARSYFSLARRLIDPPAATLVAIGGLSGTGKSVLARSLAPSFKPEPGAVILRSDVERKRIAGVNEIDQLPAESYTPLSSQHVYARLRDKAAAVLRTGHSVIVDAVHAAPDERLGIENVAAAAGVRFVGLFLTANLELREERTSQRRNDASDATVATVRSQAAYDLGEIGWAEIDAAGKPSQTFERALSRLNKNAG